MNTLQPAIVWHYFTEITQIPRPSKKEQQILAYLKSFADEHQLSYKQDLAGNLLICKGATCNDNTSKTIILQAHVDMVCEKNSDTVHNFEHDPIQTYIENDWIKAKGTTLGADNGIGMAMMMAVLASNDVLHPNIECLFTVDEETGLTGAYALQNDFLTGDVLLNLDSEDDGEIFVGCAGGIDTLAILNYELNDNPEKYFGFTISLSGLKGGHSGDDIHRGYGNAVKILNKFLWQVNKSMDLRLHSFVGGNLRNAIAREAKAIGSIPYADKERLRIMLNIFIAEMEDVFGSIEPKIKFELDSFLTLEKVIDKNTSNNLLNALYACPHGVISMSKEMSDLVETSTNLASVKMLATQQIEINTSQRSSIESVKYDIAHQVESVFLLAGAKVTHGDGYPGWKPNLDSPILKTAINAYQNLFQAEPKIRAIHAGLECGLFLKKYPHLDMISIGPTMRGVHSPDERLSISATQKCWSWLQEILRKV